MYSKYLFLLVLCFVFTVDELVAQTRSQTRGDTTTFRPKEIHDVFNNPGKGLHAFQVNTDGELVEQNYQNYPDATITYFRVYWRFLEPEHGAYRWDLIDRSLEKARERGQTVILAIVPYGSPGAWRNDVPDWYREMVGDRTDWSHDNPVNAWAVDAEDPRYSEYFGGFIRKMGERYDGNPDVEAVDVRIVGAWGEGGGSALLTRKTREALVNAYSDSFKDTPLIMLLTDERTNQYGMSQADMGWRIDCMGDLGFWADEPDKNGWTHMYDYYPQAIYNYGVRDAWKKGPVSLEICGTFNTWKEREEYTKEEVEYIFEQGLKWNMSSFNAKSAPVPEEWQPLVDEWIKKMGYRYVLRKFSFPKVAAPQGELDFSTWWENKGVSPIYKEYLFALRFRNAETTSRAVLANADIREWLPGDIIYDDKIFVPNIPEGEYILEITLVTHPRWRPGEDPEPAIKLAIEGRTDEGWYPMGKIQLERPY